MMMTSSMQKLWPFRQLVLLQFVLFSIETYRKKETTFIIKHIAQLPHNLARVHNLVGSIDRSYRKFKFSILSIVSIVFYCLSIVRLCSNFDTPLEAQDVH